MRGNFEIKSYIKGLYSIVDEKGGVHFSHTNKATVIDALKELEAIKSQRKSTIEKAKPKPKKEKEDELYA